MDFKNVNPFIRFSNTGRLCSDFSHRYAHDCRIYCLLSGTADVYIDDKHFIMRPSSIFFVSAGKKYKIVSDGANITTIHFDFDHSNSDISTPFIANGADDNPGGKKRLRSFIPEGYPPYVFAEKGGLSANDLGRIVNEFIYKRKLYQDFTSVLLKRVLIELYRIEYGSTPNIPEIVASTIKYINDNFASNLSNRVLSEISGYNERHLNRLFVTYTGISLHRYIINRRLEEAKHLLLYTDSSIASVSEQAGFANLSNFSVSFKEHTGMTPSDYRKKLRNIY